MAQGGVEDVIHNGTQDAGSVGVENGCEYNTDKESWEISLDKEDSDLKFCTFNVDHLDKNDTSGWAGDDGQVVKDIE